MFSEFEGNERERQAKLDERLATLKRAREDGFFDEEGTEEAEIVGDGTNPCDLDPFAAFTDEAPGLPPGEYPVKWPCRNPNCAYCTPRPPVGGPCLIEDEHDCDQRPGGAAEARRNWADKRGQLFDLCRRCGGHGDMVTYGNELECCDDCGGTGKASP